MNDKEKLRLAGLALVFFGLIIFVCLVAACAGWATALMSGAGICSLITIGVGLHLFSR